MTNYERYFGTPERAAEMVVKFAEFQPWLVQVSHMPDEDGVAAFCKFFDGREKFLEWMKGDD